jgi:hypothetical protein
MNYKFYIILYNDTTSWQLEDNEKAQETQAVWTSVVQVRVSVNTATMCSRHQMLGHTGGHSLRAAAHQLRQDKH